MLGAVNCTAISFVRETVLLASALETNEPNARETTTKEAVKTWRG